MGWPTGGSGGRGGGCSRDWMLLVGDQIDLCSESNDTERPGLRPAARCYPRLEGDAGLGANPSLGHCPYPGTGTAEAPAPAQGIGHRHQAQAQPRPKAPAPASAHATGIRLLLAHLYL
jgi:hypothetical protein